MADLVCNIAKGRVVELYDRVDNSDPTNAVLVLVAIDANGETDANLKDFDDLAALLAGTANEVTNSGYARIVLDDTDLTASAVDDANDWYEVDIPDQTWTAILAGDAWTDIVVCYDSDSTGGTDSDIIPLTVHDFASTPDGSDITALINVNGFFRAA